MPRNTNAAATRALGLRLQPSRSGGSAPLTTILPEPSLFHVRDADLTISELAASVAKAVRDTEELGVRGIIRNGKAVAFLVSRQVMESILETMELQKNRRFMRMVKADKAGKVAFQKVPR
jgi:hypothetical protein